MSGVKKLIQAESKGLKVPTNEEMKEKGVSPSAPNVPKPESKEEEKKENE